MQRLWGKFKSSYLRHLCWKVFVFTWSTLYIKNLFNSHGKWTLVCLFNRFLKSLFCSLVNQCEECYKNPKPPITVPGYIILRFPLSFGDQMLPTQTYLVKQVPGYNFKPYWTSKGQSPGCEGNSINCSDIFWSLCRMEKRAPKLWCI